MPESKSAAQHCKELSLLQLYHRLGGARGKRREVLHIWHHPPQQLPPHKPVAWDTQHVMPTGTPRASQSQPRAAQSSLPLLSALPFGCTSPCSPSPKSAALPPLTPGCSRQPFPSEVLGVLGGAAGGPALPQPSHCHGMGHLSGGATGAYTCASFSGPCSWYPGQ